MVASVESLISSDGDDPAQVWTSRELNGALITAVDPVIADDITRLLLDAFARPPAALREELSALLSAVPAEPRVWPTETQVSRPVFDVPPIGDVAALAAWLGMSIEELEWFAARGRWSGRASARLRHYRVTRIPKRSGGVRVIEAPKERLATVQRKILDEILSAVPPHPAAHGFVRGRSVRSFAGATYLTSLCTTVLAVADRDQTDWYHAALLRERHLPQGALTSPALLNLVLRRLDIRISGYAAKHGITYTRYADDLAFSGDGMDTGRLHWFVARVVVAEGFRLHPDKTRVMGEHQRQQLTGLVVNRGLHARRSEYDALKALLHNAAREGAASQNRVGHQDFRAHVYGRIDWVSTGSPRRRERLLEMAAQVEW